MHDMAIPLGHLFPAAHSGHVRPTTLCPASHVKPQSTSLVPFEVQAESPTEMQGLQAEAPSTL